MYISHGFALHLRIRWKAPSEDPNFAMLFMAWRKEADPDGIETVFERDIPEACFT